MMRALRVVEETGLGEGRKVLDADVG